MYENQDENEILKRMLSNVPSDVDKREGSIIFDASKPAAIEIMLLYAMQDYFLKNTFGDTAEREFLVERALERGLKPSEATPAKIKAVVTPRSTDLPIGLSLSYDEINYTVDEKLGDGYYSLICDTAGTVGNKSAGKLIPNDYVQGLETVTLTEVLVPGAEEEETEHFRARYLASFDSMAYGGNIVDYKEKVNAISGVGGCKVYPIWNGGGSVKVVFMTSEYKPPSAEFIDQVQTLLDPVKNHGEGLGIAPIGHTVTVEGTVNANVAIGLHLTVSSSVEDYKARIEALIDVYFQELNKSWAGTKVDTSETISNTGVTIRISQIESRILELEGVEDISHTTLNGVEENLTLEVNELAVRGEITWL